MANTSHYAVDDGEFVHANRMGYLLSDFESDRISSKSAVVSVRSANTHRSKLRREQITASVLDPDENTR